jgi:ribosomal protein S21
MRSNVSVELDKKRSSNKEYFEKKLNQFTREVKKAFIMEELKLKRCFYKPSRFKRVKKEITRLKWAFYK